MIHIEDIVKKKETGEEFIVSMKSPEGLFQCVPKEKGIPIFLKEEELEVVDSFFDKLCTLKDVAELQEILLAQKDLHSVQLIEKKAKKTRATKSVDLSEDQNQVEEIMGL